jgi:hypothetical protein
LPGDFKAERDVEPHPESHNLPTFRPLGVLLLYAIQHIGGGEALSASRAARRPLTTPREGLPVEYLFDPTWVGDASA